MLPCHLSDLCPPPGTGSYFEVVEDIADESDVAHPFLQRAPPCLLTVLKFLLQPIQQVPPEHISVALLGLRLREISTEHSG